MSHSNTSPRARARARTGAGSRLTGASITSAVAVAVAVAVASTAACTKAPIPVTEQHRPSDASMTALAALMKNQINPAFSKLMFLVFHGDELQEDPNAIRIEMQRFATVLRTGMGELAAWREPPTQSTEGKEVFFTYSANVDKQTQSLYDAIERRDGPAAEKQMQEIADTCNNCHHFFRLDIEDSVVPQSGTR